MAHGVHPLSAKHEVKPRLCQKLLVVMLIMRFVTLRYHSELGRTQSGYTGIRGKSGLLANFLSRGHDTICITRVVVDTKVSTLKLHMLS